MSTEVTRRVVESYLRDGKPSWLAEDVEFFEPAADQPHTGRSEVHEWQARFCNRTFSHVSVDRVALVVDDSHAVYEFLFTGVHRGSLYQEAPTGLQVTIPMAVTYQVRAGEITRARLYYGVGALPNTLGGEAIHEGGRR